ncbi:MAG: flagellar hook-length control protein FliK [Nitrospirota bacterium]
MINFKITNLGDGSLTIGKTDGQSLTLKAGDTIRAEIVEVQPSGSVVLRVRGNLFSAQTEVPLEKGSTAFFKVTDTPLSGKEFRFQFAGYAEAPEAQGSGIARGFMTTPEGQLLKELMQQLSASLPKGMTPAPDAQRSIPQQPAPPLPEGIPLDKFPLEKIEQLLKALPSDIAALPKEIRAQLQDLLGASLKSTGQSIQARLDSLLQQLPEPLQKSSVVENIRSALTVSIDKLLAGPLKESLLNTGIALEAKLKALVSSLQLQRLADAVSGSPQSPAQTTVQNPAFERELTSALMKEMMNQASVNEADKGKQDASGRPLVKPEEQAVAQQKGNTHEPSAIKHDLKAALLELKQVLSEKGAAVLTSAEAKGPAEPASSAAALKPLQAAIDGLLKDIETFQALSKTTDSFYTFLPINWKPLKDGEIAFKKRQADARGGASCSCRINLAFEQLGDLSVMVIVQDKEFFVSFKADQPALHAALDAGLDDLRDAFRQNRLNLKAAHMLDKNDRSLEQLEKLDSSEGIINIKA